MATRRSRSTGRKPDKFIRDALMVALKRPVEDDPENRKYYTAIAEKAVELALEGDRAMVKMIIERVEGRTPQAMHLAGPDGMDLAFTVTFVKPDEDGNS